MMYREISLPGNHTNSLGGRVLDFEELPSTNDYLYERAGTLPHGTVVIARNQTAGKGRLGSRWLTGGQVLCMSALLKSVPADLLPLISLSVALAVQRALSLLANSGNIGIKWPNDIVSGGKKICGILCESALQAEAGAVVCGLGINLLQPEEFFRENNLPYASSLFIMHDVMVDSLHAASTVLNEWEPILRDILKNREKNFIADYSSVCVNIGKRVKIITEKSEKEGTAVGISPDGRLRVDFGAGPKALSAGEVHVRGIMGYV